MPLTERVQTARKEAQVKRLEMKGKKGYIDHCDKNGVVDKLGFFSSQPFQKMRIEEAEKIRVAKVSYLSAVEDLDVAQIDGENLEEAKHAVAVAGLVLQNLEAARSQRPGISLTKAGSK